MYSTDESTMVAAVPRAGLWRWAIVIVWFCAMACGMWFLWQYDSIPGASAKPPSNWPENSQIQLNPSGSTLVFFAHPRCPCTRASLTEFQRILSNCTKSVTPWFVFYRPLEAEPGWEQSDLWHTASIIPGAHLVSDPGGALARHFHVFTSGETLLYDSAGHLQFSGGITSARGHEGDSLGQSAILDWLNHGAASAHESPVYGCEIAPQPTAP